MLALHGENQQTDQAQYRNAHHTGDGTALLLVRQQRQTACLGQGQGLGLTAVEQKLQFLKQSGIGDGRDPQEGVILNPLDHGRIAREPFGVDGIG